MPRSARAAANTTPREAANPPSAMPGLPCRAPLLGVHPDGRLRVRAPDGSDWLCDWLDSGAAPNPPLAEGDTLLVLPPSDRGTGTGTGTGSGSPSGEGAAGVVLGRIGAYRPEQVPATLTLRAAESLTLQCGDSHVDLRADGKLMIRGDDVLVRAKGTQRIRAGTVAIN